MNGKKNRFVLVVALLIGIVSLSSLAYANKEPKPIVSIIFETPYNIVAYGGLITEDEEEISNLQKIFKRAERREHKGKRQNPAGSWRFKIYFKNGTQLDKYTIISDKFVIRQNNYNTKKELIQLFYLSDNELSYIQSLTDKENLSQQEKFAVKDYMFIERENGFENGADDIAFIINDEMIDKIDSETNKILQNIKEGYEFEPIFFKDRITSINLYHWKNNKMESIRFHNFEDRIFAIPNALVLDWDNLLYDISLEEFNSINSLCFPDKS